MRNKIRQYLCKWFNLVTFEEFNDTCKAYAKCILDKMHFELECERLKEQIIELEIAYSNIKAGKGCLTPCGKRKKKTE